MVRSVAKRRVSNHGIACTRYLSAYARRRGSWPRRSYFASPVFMGARFAGTTEKPKRDHLPEVLEHEKMFAPQVIERLQQNRLLDVAHDIRTPLRHLPGHVLVGRPFDAREDFLVGDALFLAPLVDRQIEAEHALELL